MKSLIVGFVAIIALASFPLSNTLNQRLAAWAAPKPNPKAQAQPVHQNLPEPILVGRESLSLPAASALAVDEATNQTLFAQNADTKRPIASITKIVTALVILRDHDLNQTLTVAQLPNYSPDDQRLGLVAGQRFTYGALLTAALVPSDDDAADALALADSGTTAAFSAKMNALVKEWGIDDAHFDSASGLTDENNYATASSLVKIAKIALANDQFRHLIDSPKASIADQAGHSYALNNTDQLLGSDPRLSGIKTGYTPAAGECFVGLANINGHNVITVVLGSTDRFGVTETLINYLSRNYQWQNIPM